MRLRDGELETAIPAQLEALRKDLYERALANREARTWPATTMDEVKELAKANTGYIKTMWCVSPLVKYSP